MTDPDFTFSIPGKAVPKPRPGFRRDGSPTYTPKPARVYAQHGGIILLQAMREAGVEMFVDPVKVRVIIRRAMPKSWSKKKRTIAGALLVYTRTRCDADNVLKMILDVGNKILYLDDALVADARVVSVYGVSARVDVLVWRLPQPEGF